MLSLFMLTTWMGRCGSAWPAQKTWAEGARVSERTIRRHMKLAVKRGWLIVAARGTGGMAWRSYVYQAAIPAHIALDEKTEDIAKRIGSIDNPPVVDDDTEGADTGMSAPSAVRPRGADTIMSAPSAVGPQGADIWSSGVRTSDVKGADIGGLRVRTQLSPTNSYSETLYRTHTKKRVRGWIFEIWGERDRQRREQRQRARKGERDQLRKAIKFLKEVPEIDVERIARMFKLSPQQVESLKRDL